LARAAGAAASWLGTPVEQLKQMYGHHHPEFQSDAAEAFGRPRQVFVLLPRVGRPEAPNTPNFALYSIFSSRTALTVIQASKHWRFDESE
jgi:hypothetical protein